MHGSSFLVVSCSIFVNLEVAGLERLVVTQLNFIKKLQLKSWNKWTKNTSKLLKKHQITHSKTERRNKQKKTQKEKKTVVKSDN